MSEKVKGVHSCYTDENRILKITPIGEKSIAVYTLLLASRLPMKWEHSGYSLIPVHKVKAT